MARNDVTVEGFKELEAQLLSLAGEEADAIQRKALQAVSDFIKPALVAATPERAETRGSDALPLGALKAAVRSTVRIPQDGTPSTATIGFGRLNHIARFVEDGHINPTAKIGLKHTPPHPFVRPTEDATHDEAVDIYVKTVESGIEAALSKGKSNA